METTAWAVALDRFRGGYGGEPDLDNQTDRFLFLELLEYEIRARIEADIAKFFYAEAARIHAETEKIEAEKRSREASRGAER